MQVRFKTQGRPRPAYRLAALLAAALVVSGALAKAAALAVACRAGPAPTAFKRRCALQAVLVTEVPRRLVGSDGAGRGRDAGEAGAEAAQQRRGGSAGAAAARVRRGGEAGAAQRSVKEEAPGEGGQGAALAWEAEEAQRRQPAAGPAALAYTARGRELLRQVAAGKRLEWLHLPKTGEAPGRLRECALLCCTKEQLARVGGGQGWASTFAHHFQEPAGGGWVGAWRCLRPLQPTRSRSGCPAC